MRKIEIEIGGQWVENPVMYLPGVIGAATLLDGLAPETCQALWDLLPIETRTTHTFAAGQGWRTERNYVLRSAEAAVENLTQDLKPGDIIYHHSPGMGNYKIFMCYGIARWPMPATLIARVDENLDELVKMSRRILYEGPKNVAFRRR